MSRPRFVFLTLATGMLAGCATYHPKDIDLATSRIQLESRRLSDPGLLALLSAQGLAVTHEWDLERLTLAAFYYSPELAGARARLAEMEAGVRTAKALPNPELNFTPGYNQDASGGVTPWILGYGLSMPLELGGKRAYRTAEARWQAEAARLDLAATAWKNRSAVRRALTELHAAQDMATLWREQQPLLAQAVKLVQAQVAAGEVSPLEAAQAGIALNRAELAARESERAVASARSRLAEAIGVSLTALDEIALSFASLGVAPTPLSTVQTRELAVQNRADLLSALAAYGASQSALQIEIARQYPDLLIGPGYQLDQGEGKWALSLGFTLPLFNRNQGPIAAAEARREGAAAQFMSVQNRVLAEVDRASGDYSAALEDLKTVQAMRANLVQQAKTIRAQQAAGETSRLDLARAQLELADNARAELEARQRAELAAAALEDAVQRPLAWTESAWRQTPSHPAKTP